MHVPPRQSIMTSRLELRPSDRSDALRFFEIQSDERVARMLRLAHWPPSRSNMCAWLDDHPREWAAGTAFRFAMRLESRTIGCVDLDEIRQGRGELGYWLEPALWGRGLASEAARALMDWGFATLNLEGLDSGCTADNPASAAILAKLGFRPAGRVRRWSNPRGEFIEHLRFARQAPGR